MLKKKFEEAVKKNPIIISVRKNDDVKKAILSRSEIVFIIHIDINILAEQVKRLKNAGKIVFIHVDMIPGFQASPLALEYVWKMTKPDGIITTKKSIINKAKELDLMSILRIFAIDSATINSCSKIIKDVKPDIIEVLPGIAPKAIKTVRQRVKTAVIAGGLIETKEEVIACIKNGAIAVSTSSEKLIL